MMSSSLLMQTYAASVVAQPTVKLDDIPGFDEDQDAATRNAIALQSDLIPAISSLLSHSLAVSNLFDAEYDRLHQLGAVVDDVAKSDGVREAAARDFVVGVQQLMHAADSGQSRRNALRRTVTFYDDLLEKNTGALDADLKQAQSLVGEDRIKPLQQKLSETIEKIDSDNARIAEGATRGLISAVEIGLGIGVAYYGGAKKGFDLIIAGLKGAVEESKKEKEALDDVNEQFKIYQETLRDLLIAEAKFSVVKTSASMTDLLRTHVQGTASSLQALEDGWSGLSEGLADLTRDLDGELPATTEVASDLASVRSEWTDLHETVQHFQSVSPFSIEKSALADR